MMETGAHLHSGKGLQLAGLNDDERQSSTLGFGDTRRALSWSDECKLEPHAFFAVRIA
jgi:hypothetical protein